MRATSIIQCAGATVLSLEGQHAADRHFAARVARENPNFDKPLVIVEQQQSGTEVAMLTEAIQDTFLGLVKANECQRTSAPLSSLCPGLKCGGSDGFSGLSANPAMDTPPTFLRRLAEEPSFRFPDYAAWSKNSSTGARAGKWRTIYSLMEEYNARAKAGGPVFEMNQARATSRRTVDRSMKSAGAAKKGGILP